jgi:hypothetical protein
MKPFVFVAALALLCACSDPVTVVVPAPHGATNAVLVFDGKDTLKMSGPVDSIQLGPSAEHTCVMANGRTVTFHVGEKPGLLNLDSSAFVVFSIDYQSKASNAPNPKIVVGYVLVDSFLVHRRIVPNDHLDDANALRIAGIVQKQGNFAEVIMPMARKQLKSYPTSTEVAGVRSIGPDQLFVERYWSIELGREIPTTITGEVQKGFEQFDTERRLNGIKPAREFLLFATLSPDVYEVIDLRKLSAPE